MKKINLQKRLDKEQYILDGIRPSSKKYQEQHQRVKDIKTEIEFFELQETIQQNKDSNKSN